MPERVLQLRCLLGIEIQKERVFYWKLTRKFDGFAEQAHFCGVEPMLLRNRRRGQLILRNLRPVNFGLMRKQTAESVQVALVFDS